MNPKDFCFWIQGVIDTAKDANGDLTLVQDQVAKIEERLKEALKEPESRLDRPPGVRC